MENSAGRTIASSSKTLRKNITKACLECRRRKARCDGKLPSCSRCTDRLYHCQYAAAKDGRRPASKSYVTLLRKRISVLESVIRDHSLDADILLTPLEPIGKSKLASKDTEMSADNDTEEEHQDPWTTGELRSTMDGVLSIDGGLNYNEDGEARYFGPASGRLEFQSSPEPDDLYPLSTVSEPSSDRASGPRNTRSYNRLVQSILEEDEVPQELKAHLIDAYFIWEQPWYPVVNEKLFRQSERTNGRYCSPLLLNCIMSLGSRFTERPEVRSDVDDANTAGRVFLEKAEVLLHYGLKWPDITTIQSLAILSIIHIANGSDSLGLLHQQMAKGLAIDLGLNIDCAGLAGSVNLAPEEIELRRQIYWSLYCNDKLAGAYVGRVCTMLDCQGSVELPSPILSVSPSDDTAQHDSSLRAQRVVGIQLGLIKISQILEKIMLNLYAPKPMLPEHQRNTFMTSCLLDLRNWLYDLPAELRVEQTALGPREPQVYILQMVYQTVHILLVKPFTKPWRLQCSTETDPPHTQMDSGFNRADEICNRAAEEICAIAKQYREVFGSFRQSPITATHCILSAALVLLRPNNQSIKTAKFRSSIQICLIALEELSLSWKPAKMTHASLLKLCQKRFHPDGFQWATETSVSGSKRREPSAVGMSNNVEGLLRDDAMTDACYGLVEGDFEDFNWTDADFDLYAPSQQLDAELQTWMDWPPSYEI